VSFNIEPNSDIGKLAAAIASDDLDLDLDLENNENVRRIVCEVLVAHGYEDELNRIKQRAEKLIICTEFHETFDDQETELTAHYDNINGGDQLALLIYVNGDWQGGALRVWPSAESAHIDYNTVANKGMWTGIIIRGDIMHEPQPPTEGRRVCVAFHVDSHRHHF